MTNFTHMLMARDVAQYSNCAKRHIGCVSFTGDSYIFGYNSVVNKCTTCSRETCGAIHAEQMLIIHLMERKSFKSVDNLYLWAEVPCIQCLNFLKRYSSIRTVFCLTPQSYAAEYPLIEQRLNEILQRRALARELGITIVEYNREEILNHELHQPTEGSVQSDQA